MSVTAYIPYYIGVSCIFRAAVFNGREGNAAAKLHIANNSIHWHCTAKREREKRDACTHKDDDESIEILVSLRMHQFLAMSGAATTTRR